MKKFFAAFLAVLMTLSCFSFASAKDITLESGKDIAVAIDDVTATADDERIEVPISVAFAEGKKVAGAKIIVKYDTTKLDLIIEAPDEDEETPGTPYWTFTKAQSTGQVNTTVAGQITANFAAGTGSSATKNGFFMLEFAPKAGASGDARIWFDTAEMYFMDEEGTEFNFQTIDGKVSFPKSKVNVTFETDKGTAPEAITGIDEGTEITLDELTHDDFAFLGWKANGEGEVLAAGTKYTVTGNVVFTAVWGGATKVYLSDNGDDANDGMTAETAVRHINRANTLLAEYTDADTLVVVDIYSICKEKAQSNGQIDTVGVADKTITIKGLTPDAIFNMDRTYNSWDDAKVVLAGPVVFENITIQGENNDGYLRTDAKLLEIGEGVSSVEGKKDQRIVPGNNMKNNQIIINSGEFHFNVASTETGAKTNETYLTINGGKVGDISIGKGNFGNPSYSGLFNVEINGGEVDRIILKSTGTAAENSYRGLRYYTINGGKVGNILTTASDKYMQKQTKNTTLEGNWTYTDGTDRYTSPLDVAYRKGVTVFEINAANVVEGTIAPAYKSKLMSSKKNLEDDTTAYAYDAATRIIIYNNGTYVDGQVLDDGAYVFDVKNGSIKALTTELAADADLNAWADSIELLGFSYTLPEGSNANYVRCDELGRAYKLSTLADNIIPADLLGEAGVYTLEFVEMYNVTLDEKSYLMPKGEEFTLTKLNPKDGFVHVGWSTVENATEAEYDCYEDIVVDGDIKLYSVWAEAISYTAYFESAHGEAIDAITRLDDDADGFADGAIVLPGYSTTVKYDDHFTFAGWSVAGETKVYLEGEEIVLTEDVTFVAIWEEDPKATVTYDLVRADDVSETVYVGDIITLLTPDAVTGYTFINWTVDDAEYAAGAEYTVDGDVTFVAAWEINKYNVKFGSEDATVYEYGTEITLPDYTPEDPDEGFGGWKIAGDDKVYAAGDKYTVTNDVAFVPVITGSRKVYLSDNGDDANDGMTAATAVKHIERANELLAAEDKDILVIVGLYTTNKEAGTAWSPVETIGVTGKALVVTGYDENAIFSFAAANDARAVFAGDTTFRKITILGQKNDGRAMANGRKVTFEDSVKTASTFNETTGLYSGRITMVAGSGSRTAEIVLNGGEFGRVYSGDFGATYTGASKVIVNGAIVEHIGLGKGYKAVVTSNGLFEVTVNDGEIAKISLDSDGTDATTAYTGVRYYTLNGGKVGKIITTSGSAYKNGGSATDYSTTNNRNGVTVFEVNAPDIITGQIMPGTNKKTKGLEADNAERVVIFNNGSFVEGKVEDGGAFVYNVKNGALKAVTTELADGADIGAWASTVQLLGYSYTLPADGEYNAVKVGDKTYILSDLEGNLIPKDVARGTYDVEFTNAYKVTIGDVTYTVEEGDTIELTRLPQDGSLKHIGWATVEGATVATIDHTTNYAPTAHVTLYPVWAEAVTFTVTFETAHGETPDAVSVIDDDEDGKADEAIALPGYDGKVDDHFTFAGWAVKGNEETVYNAGDEIILEGNITLVSTWTEDPKGTVTYVDDQATAPEAVTDYVGEKITVAQAGTVAGLEFLGWTSGDAIYQAGEKITVTAEGITLTAKWGVKLMVNANGAKGEAPVIGGTIGEVIDLSTYDEGGLTKVNNTFLGWALSADGEVLTEYTVNAGDVLYAIWTETVADAAIIETKVVYNSATNDYTVDMYYYGKDANTVAFGYEYGENLTFISFTAAEDLEKVPSALETKEDGYYAFAVTNAIEGKIAGSTASAGNGIHLGTLTFAYELTKEDYSADDEADNIIITAPKSEVEYISSADYFLYTPAVVDLTVTGLPVVFDEAITYEVIDVIYAVNGSVKVVRDDDLAPANYAEIKVFNDKGTLVKTFAIEDEGTVTENGVFEYTIGLAAGEYTFEICKTGYACAFVDVTIEAQEGADQDGFVPTPVEVDLVTLVAGDVVAEKDVIDLLDFAAITSVFGAGELSDSVVAALDIDEDGAVTVDDLAYVKANFGYKG